jgi:DNA-directed RNA polymerase subunit RPC12/RpoP
MLDYALDPDEDGPPDDSLPGGWYICGPCWRDTWHTVAEFSDRTEYRCAECGAVTSRRRRAE